MRWYRIFLFSLAMMCCAEQSCAMSGPLRRLYSYAKKGIAAWWKKQEPKKLTIPPQKPVKSLHHVGDEDKFLDSFDNFSDLVQEQLNKKKRKEMKELPEDASEDEQKEYIKKIKDFEKNYLSSVMKELLRYQWPDSADSNIISMLTILLKKGADANAIIWTEEKEEITVLALVVWLENLGAVPILMDHGADPLKKQTGASIRTSALAMALMKQKKKIAVLMLQKVAAMSKEQYDKFYKIARTHDTLSSNKWRVKLLKEWAYSRELITEDGEWEGEEEED